MNQRDRRSTAYLQDLSNQSAAGVLNGGNGDENHNAINVITIDKKPVVSGARVDPYEEERSFLGFG